MAILQTDPADWRSSNTVQVDSTARDNMSAIREIDQWAADNGFHRVNEYWLRQVNLKDGTRVFRGICFRITEEERSTRHQTNEDVARRMARMPATAHTVSQPD
ncbi:MAG: hypothetical protein ACREIT_01935 [Tepidisphaeraceae bacterium]